MMLKHLIHRAGHAYLARVTASEAAAQTFTRINERPVEYGYALEWLNRLQPRLVVDIGTGKTAWPSLLRTCGFVVTATDNVRDYLPRGMVNRHWQVLDDDITASRLPREHFDVATCLSVLEHIADPVEAVAAMRERLRVGGHLILTTPYGAVGHPNVYTEATSYGRGNPYPCRQSCPDDLTAWLATGLQLVDARYWRAFTDTPFWSCGPLLRPIEPSDTPAQLGTFLLERVR